MSNKRHARVRLSLGLIVGLIVVVGVWVVVNLLGRGEAPTPLWTASDLPVLPPEADNGWVLAKAYEPDEGLHGVLAGLQPVEADNTKPLWNSYDLEDRQVLREAMDSAAGADSLARLAEMRGRPAFVARCGFTNDCGLFNGHQFHQIASYRAIDLVFRGAEAQAIGLVTDMVRLDRSNLVNASSWLSLAIALDGVSDDIVIADALIQRGGPEGDTSGLAVLVAEVAAIEVELHDLGPVVIGEYLHMLEGLDLIEHPEKGGPEFRRPEGPRWLFDPAQTRREIDVRFAARHAAAIQGDVRGALGIGEVSPKEKMGWWLRNAAGDIVLDAMTAPLDSLADDIEGEYETLARQRAQLLDRAEAASLGD